jgi:hypothetical protein
VSEHRPKVRTDVSPGGRPHLRRLRQWALPPAYYQRAAIIHAHRGQHEQAAAVCERHEQNTPAGTGGALRERLSAARACSGNAAR